MTAPPFGNPLTEEQRRRGNDTTMRRARAARTRKWLDYEDVIDKAIKDTKCTKRELCELIKAQDTVADRLRILSGAVKPGSRNVSVRELAPSEHRRLGRPPKGRVSDYLAEADAILQAEAEAARAAAASSTSGVSADSTEAGANP